MIEIYFPSNNTLWIFGDFRLIAINENKNDGYETETPVVLDHHEAHEIL